MTTKLLAVDDSKTLRKVLEITFGGDEFQTTIAGSPADALSAVQADPPAIAVVDAHLGSSSGYDLCQQIKQASPGTKVIILSSKQRPYDAAAGSAAGADANFDKPFDSTKMIAKVAEIAASAPAPVAAAPAPRPVAPAPVPVAAAPAPRPAAPAPVAAVPSPERRSATGQRPQAPPPRAAVSPPQVSAPAVAPASAPAAIPASAPKAAPAAASTVVAAAAADLEGKLQGLGLTSDQMAGVLSLSREVVEQVVWEVVPTLAETLIKEEIARLTAE